MHEAGIRSGVAYVAAYFTVTSLAVGALLLLMIMCLSHATWFVPMKRAAEAVVETLPLCIVLFIPIAISTGGIFPWVHSSHPWWGHGFFIARSFGYVVIWCGFAFAWRRLGADTNVLRARARQRVLSGAGIPIVALTFSFAGFDWIMSLTPHWVSDAFGLYLATGAFAGGVGVVAALAFLSPNTHFSGESAPRPDHVHALGRVVWVGVILWAYVGFCQFLIIWITNLPREITFYDDRAHGAWARMSAALVVLHFIIPFVVLLSRSFKRSMRWVAVGGIWMVAVHTLDVLWDTLPSGGRDFNVVELVPTVLLLALFIGVSAFRYRARAAVPETDADLAASLRYESP